jgi:hypothetical protein
MKKTTKKTTRLRAGTESDDTQTAYRVAAFQTFLSGRISTFGDTFLDANPAR